MALPFLVDCTGYFLFGTNQALSIANQVSAPNPLTVIGSPVYGSNYVRLLQADGYQTATNFAGYAYTGIAITTNGDRAANAGPTQGHFWLSRNAGAIRGFPNPDQLFTTGGTPSIDSAGDTSKRPSTRLARMFEAKAISESTTTATLMVQDGFSLREYSSARATTPAVTASPFNIVGGFGFATTPATDYIDVAAAAFYTRYMTAAEINQVVDAMWADLQGRGLER